jgi:hypothetical protein
MRKPGSIALAATAASPRDGGRDHAPALVCAALALALLVLLFRIVSVL